MPISSFVAGLLAAPEPAVLAGALQLAQLLMEKLPDVFRRWVVTPMTLDPHKVEISKLAGWGISTGF